MSNSASFEKYHAALGPNGHLISHDDIAHVDEHLSGETLATLGKWVEDHTHTLGLNNGQRYRMLVDRPTDGNLGKAVVVFGEFGNGLSEGVAARARIVRDMVDPAATLIIQPNSTHNEDNMNFSSTEKKLLKAGFADPLLHRVDNTLYRVQDPANVTLFGPSQGGTVALAYAASSLTRETATSVIEVPNIKQRSTLNLLGDFAVSGAALKQVVQDNFDNPTQSVLASEMAGQLSALGFLRYGIGIARSDNRALKGAMCTDTAIDDIGSLLGKGSSLVHAWGTVAKVSPVSLNRDIAASHADSSLYQDVEIDGADHSITNAFVLAGALTRQAYRLMHT